MQKWLYPLFFPLRIQVQENTSELIPVTSPSQVFKRPVYALTVFTCPSLSNQVLSFSRGEQQLWQSNNGQALTEKNKRKTRQNAHEPLKPLPASPTTFSHKHHGNCLHCGFELLLGNLQRANTWARSWNFCWFLAARSGVGSAVYQRQSRERICLILPISIWANIMFNIRSQYACGCLGMRNIPPICPPIHTRLLWDVFVHSTWAVTRV